MLLLGFHGWNMVYGNMTVGLLGGGPIIWMKWYSSWLCEYFYASYTKSDDNMNYDNAGQVKIRIETMHENELMPELDDFTNLSRHCFISRNNYFLLLILS